MSWYSWWFYGDSGVQPAAAVQVTLRGPSLYSFPPVPGSSDRTEGE